MGGGAEALKTVLWGNRPSSCQTHKNTIKPPLHRSIHLLVEQNSTHIHNKRQRVGGGSRLLV